MTLLSLVRSPPQRDTGQTSQIPEGEIPGRRRSPRQKSPIWLNTSLIAMMAAATPVATATASPTPSAPRQECQASSPQGPLFITASCVDPVLNAPYIDAKQPGSITDDKTGVTVDFTYVHGGFTGTNTRFAFYFPAKNKYRGRFFETTYPTLGKEGAAPGCPQIGTSACSIVFALSNGAYVVSSNNAGGVPSGGVLAPYRANAASAKYSRVVAAQMYGTSARSRGYLYGASGGGYQTVGSIENTDGIWDGAVPMVFGAPNAIPSFMASQVLALRVLKDKLPQIADAMAPGGSGDPYAGLTPEQASTLREVTRLGAPLRGWWQYATLKGGAFYAVEGVVRTIDPTYVKDFWDNPAYEGSQPALRAIRVRHDTMVTASPAAQELVLADVPQGDLGNADLVITGGPNAGQSLHIMSVDGNRVKIEQNPKIAPGTPVQIDNSWLIALQYYPRHQIPTPAEYGWKQYMGADGTPLYVQRRPVVGPILNAGTAGSMANGHFHGKMIMAESAMDIQAYPWSADWYRSQIRTGQNSPDNFRVWYMDNADHGPDLSSYEAGVGFAGVPGAVDHIVGYLGEVEQALLYLDAWVTTGAPAPASTGYVIDADNQVQLAAGAALRHGVQPVVSLTGATAATGPAGPKVEVAANQPVRLIVKAQVPPGAGKIVKVEWDLEGQGKYTGQAPLAHASSDLSLERTYSFATPGTYFPAVRVTSQRDGDIGGHFGLVQNLARTQVIVR